MMMYCLCGHAIIHRSGGRWWKWGRPGRIHHMNDVRWTWGGCRRIGPVVDSVCHWWVHHAFGQVWGFTVAWDPGCCRQLRSTMFKLSCGWAPPPTSTWCHWHVMNCPRLSPFHCSSASVYCCECRPNNETRGDYRPRNEATIFVHSCYVNKPISNAHLITPWQQALWGRHYGKLLHTSRIGKNCYKNTKHQTKYSYLSLKVAASYKQ